MANLQGVCSQARDPLLVSNNEPVIPCVHAALPPSNDMRRSLAHDLQRTGQRYNK